MDFGTLLHMAKKNSESNKNEGKFYSTKFAPPKKETKEKKLSNNIQKFLQKRDEEERRKQREEREKLANLLAMRDEKSKNKIKKMLKVTKSANKSVLDDAVNTDHTAVTMEGPEQPDQDDYGYVSNEANAFYQKYIEKVKDVKEDKGFAPSRPQSLRDLTGTKERVKAAITRETEEKKSHTRQRSSATSSSNSNSSSSGSGSGSSKDPSNSVSRASTSSKPVYDPEAERREEERKKREEEQKRAKNRKPLPPPMDFQALLKLAEKKQHEPVEIVPEVKKKKEPERLLTLKEKRELEERQRAKEERARRDRERERERERDQRNSASLAKERKENRIASASSTPIASVTSRMESNGRIPKLNQAPRSAPVTLTAPNGKSCASAAKPAVSNDFKKPYSTTSANASTSAALPKSASAAGHVKTSSSSATSSTSTKLSSHTAKPAALPSASAARAPSASSSALASSKNPYGSSASKSASNAPTREFPPRDLKSVKPRQLSAADVQKTRQFPPPDVCRSGHGRPGDNKKQAQAPKRRIIDDEDEDEYDSELDDFIDDGDCEEDYSSHIKAIFGYDRSKYRHVDDDDDAAMESNFAQVQREEYISKKIGLQEDLEDMKLEAMEKKRKMISKKRKIHD